MKQKGIDILIDKLTNSITNRLTGEVFQTTVLAQHITELKGITKRNGWLFNWKEAYKTSSIFKLVTIGNEQIIQGLIALREEDGFLYVSLIENAPFNLGSEKVYEGVAGNLFAFACKLSMEKGFEGYVSFHAKTDLIEHYKTALGAKQIGSSLLMVIDTAAALRLIHQYYKTK
jgi:hypothetical protein